MGWVASGVLDGLDVVSARRCSGAEWRNGRSGTAEGWGAEFGEREKESSWDAAVRRRQEESAHCVEFVPFSLEAGGVWGPAAKRFFKRCVAQADNQDRDVDLYH